jgi:hypothetical protein
MVIAQALGEYGMMSALSSALTSGWARAEGFVRGLGPTEYGIIFVVCVVLVKVFRSPARRGL